MLLPGETFSNMVSVWISNIEPGRSPDILPVIWLAQSTGFEDPWRFGSRAVASICSRYEIGSLYESSAQRFIHR